MKSLSDIFKSQNESISNESDESLSSIVFDQDNVFIKFAVGEALYICPIELVKEVLENREIPPLPISFDNYKGIINLRGAILPVFEMHESGSSFQDRIVVFDSDDNLFGIVASQVKRVFVPHVEKGMKSYESNDVVTIDDMPVKFFSPSAFLEEITCNEVE